MNPPAEQLVVAIEEPLVQDRPQVGPQNATRHRHLYLEALPDVTHLHPALDRESSPHRPRLGPAPCAASVAMAR